MFFTLSETEFINLATFNSSSAHAFNWLQGETETFPKQHILDSSKLKEFADDNLIFDENGRKFSKWVKNTVGKG